MSFLPRIVCALETADEHVQYEGPEARFLRARLKEAYDEIAETMKHLRAVRQALQNAEKAPKPVCNILRRQAIAELDKLLNF